MDASAAPVPTEEARVTSSRRAHRRGSTVGGLGLRALLAGAAAVYLVALLGVGPASATAWVAIPDQETVGFNPCTGEDVLVLLHDVRLLVSGPGAGHEGLKVKGRFTTDDGFSGTFHDQDQWNDVPRGDGVVVTRVLMFRGADDTGRRAVFTAVAHTVDRDGVVVTSIDITQARCVGRR